MEEDNCSEFTQGSEKLYVGFGGKLLNIIMIVISIAGIIINSTFSIIYLKKIITIKNKNNLGVSAVEKILSMVAGIETLISICWLLNNCILYNSEKLPERCLFCKILAHVKILFYLFDWLILSTSLYQIKIILLNPQQILESGKRVIKYLLICLVISVSSLIFSISAGIGGVSPMLTCFINIRTDMDSKQKIYVILFFLLPIFCFSFGIYQVILIMKSPQYKNDKNNKEFFIEYSYFVITYIFFSFLLILSYIFNIFKAKNIGEGYKFIMSIITLLSCSTPLIVGLIRATRTGFFKRIFSKKKKKVKENEEQLVDNNERKEEGRMFDLEKKLLEKLIIKYFTALSYALGKSKYMNDDIEEESKINEDKNGQINLNEHADYKITKSEILKDLDLSINEDIKVLQESYIDIEVTEYNTSIFKKLRELEGFNEDKIISMFQPKKGTNQLINKINDTFYINSTNKLLMLKQIKKESLFSFQRNILPSLYNYFANHQNSLICRIFGLYRIKIDNQDDNYMALMYNITESLESIDNLNFIKPKNDMKKMKITEAELKKNIIIDSKTNKQEFRNFTIDIPKNKFDGSIMVGGSSSDSNSKTFKLHLSDYENDKLIKIINQDTEFLREKNIYNFQFLIFEKNIEFNERIALFKDDEENSENRNQLTQESKFNSHVKRYIFNSTLPNIIYNICILNYFRQRA